jgi:hypothetical protein
MSSKARWLWLSFALATVWAYYTATLLRQIRLLETVAPASDTGVSFGYGFLVRFCGPALFLLTLLAVGAVLFLNARLRKRHAQKAPSSSTSK